MADSLTLIRLRRIKERQLEVLRMVNTQRDSMLQALADTDAAITDEERRCGS